jgi:hypothetical protein
MGQEHAKINLVAIVCGIPRANLVVLNAVLLGIILGGLIAEANVKVRKVFWVSLQ